MASTSVQAEGRDVVLPTLDVLIQMLEIAKDACRNIPKAQIAVGSVSALLIMIRNTVANDKDYVNLGRDCGEVCKILSRGLNISKTSQALFRVASLSTSPNIPCRNQKSKLEIPKR